MKQRRRPPLPIIYEDDRIVVIDKPAGLLTTSTRLRVHLRQRGRLGRDPRQRLGLMHRQKRMVKSDDGFKHQSYANDKENGAGYKAEPFFKFGNASE